MENDRRPIITLSSDAFRYWIIDHEKRQVRIVLKDGSELS